MPGTKSSQSTVSTARASRDYADAKRLRCGVRIKGATPMVSRTRANCPVGGMGGRLGPHKERS